MPKAEPLFDTEFLQPYLERFQLSEVVNIYAIRKTLLKWIESFESGTLDSLKEESIKSLFLTELFGDALGFNYNHTGKWLFLEEAKTVVDATKPDAALGTFYVSETGLKSDVRIVIEVKGTTSSLDEKQKRTGFNGTAVEQAMLYASKMDGNCRWVVVTNLKEIRFYQANDQNRSQRYQLRELKNDENLKELLFLFHRDRFYKGTQSATERLVKLQRVRRYEPDTQLHIIDQLHQCLKRFDQLTFTDPKYLANLKPFNTLDEYVWHYEGGHLFSLNPQIYTLLQAIRFENQLLVLDETYEAKLKQLKIIEYRQKLDYIFNKLHGSHVVYLSAIPGPEIILQKNKRTIGFSLNHIPDVKAYDGVILELDLTVNTPCGCFSCRYHSLDFRKILEWMRDTEGQPGSATLEVAYAHYKFATDNYKQAYRLYKTIENEAKGDEKRLTEYFIAKYNLRNLHNLVFDDTENKALKKELRAIDLDRIVNDELDLHIGEDVRKLLLEIKEDRLFSRTQARIRVLLRELRHMRAVLKNGDRMSAPDYLQQLYSSYAHVFAHYQNNYLIQDVFTPYQRLATDVFRAQVISYRTPKKGIQKLQDFQLTEALLYLEPKDFQRYLAKLPGLAISEKTETALLEKARNFFSSGYHETVFGRPLKDDLLKKQLLNYRFKDTYANIFSNLCSLLSCLKLEPEAFGQVTSSLLNFITANEDVLNRWDFNQLGELLRKNGQLFTLTQLEEILSLALQYHRPGEISKYQEMIGHLCGAIRRSHPEYRFHNKQLAKKAVINLCSGNSHTDLRYLDKLWHIADEHVRQYLSLEFEESLDQDFNYYLYEHLLKANVIAHDRKDYLQQLAIYVERHKGSGLAGFKRNRPNFQDLYSYNFLLIPYVLDLGFDLPEFQMLSNLSPFETWLSNPDAFDYNNFDPRWLLAANSPLITKRLRGHPDIQEQLANYLKGHKQKILSKVYFKYFA